MKKLLFLFLFTLCAGVYHTKAQTYFPKEALTKDLDTSYSVIHRVHPDMFATLSPGDFERNLRDLKASMNDLLTA